MAESQCAGSWKDGTCSSVRWCRVELKGTTAWKGGGGSAAEQSREGERNRARLKVFQSAGTRTMQCLPRALLPKAKIQCPELAWIGKFGANGGTLQLFSQEASALHIGARASGQQQRKSSSAVCSGRSSRRQQDMDGDSAVQREAPDVRGVQPAIHMPQRYS